MATMTGVFRWEVDKDSISKVPSLSHEIKVGGITWRLVVCKHVDNEHLSVGLAKWDSDYKVDSVDVISEFQLINKDDGAKTLMMKLLMKTYDESQGSRSYGFPEMAKWEQLIDENTGFIKENKLTVQVEFWLSNIIKPRNRRHVDNNDQDEPTHDVSLIVDGQKFNVNKGYLSIISPVFHSMFYGNFDEKTKKEIELKEINREEFGELMDAIYPPYKSITDANFDYLLKLADRFEIYLVIDRVEQFLIESTRFTVAAKLVHAGRYGLSKLQINCLSQLKTVKDVKNIKKTKESMGFTDAINLALLSQIVKLSE